MKQIFSSPLEPKRLTIIRIIIILLIVSCLGTVLFFQIYKYCYSYDVYRVSYKLEKVQIPGVLFVCDYSLVPESYNVLGNSIDETGRPVVANSNLTSNMYSVKWGRDIFAGPFNNPKRNAVDNRTQEAWHFIPKKNWLLTPLGIRRNNTDQEDNINFFEIQFAFTRNTNLTTDTAMKVYILERKYIDQLLNARDSGVLVGVDLIDSAVPTKVQWGTQKNIQLQQYYNVDGKKVETKYETKVETLRDHPTRMIVNIQSVNFPDFERDLYQVKTIESVALMLWYEMFPPLGGVLSIALYMFTFLFGQKRLKPWGIMQQLFLRKRILSKVPRSVAVIGSAWGTPKYNPPGHDSALEHQIEEAAHESTRPPAIPPTYSEAIQTNRSHTTIQFADDPHPRQRQVPGMPNSLLEAFQQLREEMDEMKARQASTNSHAQPTSTTRYLAPSAINTGNQTDVDISVNSSRASNYNMFTNARLAELEAFRQRIELFYLASDLFEVQGGPDANKRSTLQIISNLNL
ncbi:hypothetical protein BDF22DRAFT_700856 [Syncephalis plumigaleata]|nr:hypothetical protein BDF22DRAFT_700856 [Syncephalis plumigaleata]